MEENSSIAGFPSQKETYQKFVGTQLLVGIW